MSSSTQEPLSEAYKDAYRAWHQNVRETSIDIRKFFGCPQDKLYLKLGLSKQTVSFLFKKKPSSSQIRWGKGGSRALKTAQNAIRQSPKEQSPAEATKILSQITRLLDTQPKRSDYKTEATTSHDDEYQKPQDQSRFLNSLDFSFEDFLREEGLRGFLIWQLVDKIDMALKEIKEPLYVLDTTGDNYRFANWLGDEPGYSALYHATREYALKYRQIHMVESGGALRAFFVDTRYIDMDYIDNLRRTLSVYLNDGIETAIIYGTRDLAFDAGVIGAHSAFNFGHYIDDPKAIFVDHNSNNHEYNKIREMVMREITFANFTIKTKCDIDQLSDDLAQLK